MQAHSPIDHRLNLPERYRYERVLGHPTIGTGERLVIADLQGPGCIRHFYCTNGGPVRGIFKKCVNSQAVYLLSEQHGLEAQERR